MINNPLVCDCSLLELVKYGEENDINIDGNCQVQPQSQSKIEFNELESKLNLSCEQSKSQQMYGYANAEYIRWKHVCLGVVFSLVP